MKMRTKLSVLVPVFLGSLLVAGSAGAALKLVATSASVTSPQSDLVTYLDVYFVETPTVENEKVFSYSVMVNLVGATPAGVRFNGPAIAPTDPHPYILTTGAPVDYGSTYKSILAAHDLPTGNRDIADNAGVLRLPVLIPANTPPGAYPITFDPDFTTFGSESANNTVVDNGAVLFTPQPGVLTIMPVPEPAALGLLGLAAGALLLRRRRAA